VSENVTNENITKSRPCSTPSQVTATKGTHVEHHPHKYHCRTVGYCGYTAPATDGLRADFDIAFPDS
jgi:hypothetical protein